MKEWNICIRNSTNIMKSKEDSKTTVEVELESLGCIKSFVLQASVPQWTTCS